MWRILVIRKNPRCVVCNTLKSRQAHHKNSSSYFPEDRFDVNNGVTLCYSCHMNYHCNYHKSYRMKCTKYDFDNFMSLVRYFKTVKWTTE